MRVATYQPRLIYPDIPTLEQADYELGLNCFIQEFLEACSGQVAFYQFGQVETPSVSDIDLLIVTKEEVWKEAAEKARDIIGSSGLLTFLFTHDPLVVCESLLPSLPFLHTLENCGHIYGDWDPVTQLAPDRQDESDRIMRHMAWNSFMRMAALEMDGKSIGSRRALILMHNLLTTAHHSNHFLSSPIAISLDTREIRDEILSAPLSSQEALIRDYIERIVSVLNEVDGRLDEELLSSAEGSTGARLTVFESRSRLVVSPLSCLGPAHASTDDRILRNVQVVPVPRYLVLLTSRLARAVGAHIAQLDGLRSLSVDGQLRGEIDISTYARHFERANSVSQAHGVDLDIAPPFSHRPSRRSLPGRLLWWLRVAMLRRQARAP